MFRMGMVHILHTDLNPNLNKSLQINQEITQSNRDKVYAAFRSGSCLLKLNTKMALLGRISGGGRVFPKGDRVEQKKHVRHSS